VEGLVVVPHGVREWLLPLKVVARQAFEIIAAQIEIAAIALPGEIDARRRFAEIIPRKRLARHVIVVQVPFVRKKREFPTEFPLIGDIKLALAFERTAQA